MTQLSKERLEEIAEDGFLKHGEAKAIARRLLAAEAQEPVGYIAKYESGAVHGTCESDDPVAMEWLKRGMTLTPLYAAPPVAQPVQVPDEITFEKIAEITASQGYEYSINECICAASWWNACRAAMLQPSQLPDGWKIVPVEPTAAMYEAGDQQLATKQVWDAMLAAAPQEPAK